MKSIIKMSWLILIAGLLFGFVNESSFLRLVSNSGTEVEVELNVVFEALRQQYLDANLRYENLESVANTIIISKPEIKINGTWYPFNNCNGGCFDEDGIPSLNICLTFGLAEFIGATVRGPNQGDEFPVKVNHEGRIKGLNTSGKGYIVTQISCSE